MGLYGTPPDRLIHLNRLARNWPPPTGWAQPLCREWDIKMGELAHILYEMLMNNMVYEYPILWFFSLKPGAASPDPEHVRRAPIWHADPEILIYLHEQRQGFTPRAEAWVDGLLPSVQQQVVDLLLWMVAVNEKWIRENREACREGACHHWWHGDLEDPNYIASILRPAPDALPRTSSV